MDEDVRFLESLLDDLGEVVCDNRDLFPADRVPARDVWAAQLVAFLAGIRPEPLPRSIVPLPAIAVSERVGYEERIALTRAAIRLLATGDGDPDLVALVAEYDAGSSGREAARRAGLGGIRTATALMRLARLLQAWPNSRGLLH